MIRAAYESSNFWYRELVDIPKYPIAENAYGSNRDSGLSVPLSPVPPPHASDTTASLDGTDTVERYRHREHLSHAVVRRFRHGADAIKRIALFWRDQGDRNGKLPAGPSISKSMQVPVREREVLRDDRTPPDAVSVSSSPSDFVSCRTGCPPKAAGIVHRPAKRHTFESTERDGDWPKLAGLDLMPSTTSNPNPEIRILTRMPSALRLSATFASRAIALPAVLVLGLGLLGSTTAWAQSQSSVDYSFCVSVSKNLGGSGNSRIRLTVGSTIIIDDRTTLTEREFCENSAVGVGITTEFRITPVYTEVDESLFFTIRNAQTGTRVNYIDLDIGASDWLVGSNVLGWPLDIRYPISFYFSAISENEIGILNEPQDPRAPEFRESIPDQEYTVGEPIDELTLPEAAGGTTPLTYDLSPDLPDGLRFDASTRRLSGTPTAVSPRTSYTYTVTDNDERTAPLSFTITVSAADPEFSESIPDQEYTVGEPIDELTLPAAVGGTAPLAYALSPALPDGLRFDASTRRLSGTPTAVSSETRYTYTVTDSDGRTAPLSFTITVSAAAAAAPEFSESIPDQEYTVGEPIDELTLPAAVGGTAPLAYALSPALPDGLGFDRSTRRLSGTPTAVSSETRYTYTVTDNDGRTAPLSFTITVSAAAAAAPEFSESIPDQEYTVGEPIDELTLPAAVGGTAPLAYALSPALPDGLRFDASTRRLSGTPTAVSSETRYTYTVTDSDGRTAPLSFTITVSAAAAAAPEFSESIPDQEYTVGEPIDELTLPAAVGGTAPLAYALSPALPDGLGFDRSTRRLSGTPTAVSSETRYTYTVTDNDDPRRSTMLSFTITVSAALPVAEAEEKQTVNQTVAAVAATVASNVTSNVGARFSAPAPSGGLSLNFAGSPTAREIGSLGDFRSGFRADHFSVLSADERRSQRRTMTVSELLNSGSFELVLGATEGNDDDVSDGLGRVAFWGRGDFQLFESGGGQNSSYDGNLRAAYLGADVVMSEGFLAGIAVSRIAAKADYSLGNGTTGGGKLEAKLTSIHPYLRAAVSDRSEAWVILGFGQGELTNISQATSLQSKSDLSMTMLSVGARHRLETDSDIDWAVLVDASSASVKTDEGVQLIDGITANVWRGRLGVEASTTTVSDDGSSLTSFVEVAGRKDGGDSVRGTGLEISPGVVYSDPENRLSVEARGRALALHSADNHREYGVSITARLTPRANGLGLSMAVTPTWGTPDSSLNDATDAASLFRSNAADRRSRSLSLNTQIAYGLAARNGVLTPFANFSSRDKDSSQLRIGLRYNLGSLVELELSGDRKENASKSPDHSVQFVGGVRF